jgi:hypothetical protein
MVKIGNSGSDKDFKGSQTKFISYVIPNTDMMQKGIRYYTER